MDTPLLDFSVVIPVKNEEDNISPLVEELAGVMRGLGSFEIIMIDDGSTDQTWKALQVQKTKTPELRLMKFDRNYGQSAGLWAGLKRMRGRIAITMDGDMQNDPADIARTIEELNKGADICLTYRSKREDTWARKFQSRVGNGMRNWILKSDIRDTGSQLRAFRAECIKDMPPFNGMHRFIGNLFLMYGFHLVQIPTHHRSRHAGVAKYGMGNRAWRGLKDLLAVRWFSSRVIRYKMEHEDA